MITKCVRYIDPKTLRDSIYFGWHVELEALRQMIDGNSDDDLAKLVGTQFVQLLKHEMGET